MISNKEYQKEWKRKWRGTHREEYNQYMRDYGKEYRSRIEKQKLRAAQTKRSYEKLKNDVMDVLGGKCVRCGFLDRRALQVDHINGGGRAEYLKTGSRNVYKKIRDGHTEGYQLLCSNCNWIKRHENRERKWGYLDKQ